jgi:hypothetical protein
MSFMTLWMIAGALRFSDLVSGRFSAERLQISGTREVGIPYR